MSESEKAGSTHNPLPEGGSPMTETVVMDDSHHQGLESPSTTFLKIQNREDQQPQKQSSGTSPLFPPESEIDYYGLVMVFLAPALGGFLYGYDIGATSFVLAMMRSSRDPDTWWHEFSIVEQGLLVSSLSLGALVGSHIVLVYLANSIGRRKEIRVAASLYVVGTMCNVMSGTILANTPVGSSSGMGIGIVTLVVGRMTYGAGVGFIMHGAPTYMAEMSPSAVRGALVSAKETVIVFGIIVGMMMGDLMSDYPDNWTDLYAFAILGAIPMLLLTFKIPRSKRWLLMKGYHEEARESMRFVYKGNVEDEFDRMTENIGGICCRNGGYRDRHDDDISISSSVVCTENQAGKISPMGEETSLADIPLEHHLDDRASYCRDIGSMSSSRSEEDGGNGKLTSRRYRPIMMIGLTLLVAQQASGQPSILAYSRVLFAAAGFQGHASVVTVLIMGCTSAITVALVDRLGRKALLLSGCAIMGTALLALALGFWDYDIGNDRQKISVWQQHVVLWSMFVYIAGYQVGYGPISWTLLSEIYPAEIRGAAMALSVEVNFFFKFLVQLCFPIVLEVLGWVTTFIVFACLIVLSFLFIFFKVPETKGLTLEEIQLQLRGLRQQPSAPCYTKGQESFVNKAPLLQGTEGSSSMRAKRLTALSPIA